MNRPLSPVIALTASLLATTVGRAADTSPQAPESLKPMLTISWKPGPDLPQGFQDSDGGFIGSTLITVGGFCQGRVLPAKPNKYPRGFLKKAWGLDVDRGDQWVDLPELPGEARQELFAAPVGDALYMWGGVSYTSPFCYADGYRLSKKGDAWTWDKLPPLPSPACGSGIAAIDTRIYVLGGADYDSEHFYTIADRAGRQKRLGARFLTIDTTSLKAGWKRLPECPGTPRWVHAMAAVGGRIYVIGGATGDVPGAGYCTVVDNWVFDTATQKWSRLRDTPVSTGNFASGAIAYKDRYILLVGGAQYPKVCNPDGTLRDKYGKASRYKDQGDYFNDVFVYDTKTETFGTATKLPLNNNLPMTVVRGDHIYLIGGETGGCTIEGEAFGHHPDLLLIGTASHLNARDTAPDHASRTPRETGR